ncbi:citryl-CoA lyase [Pseudonocardia sp. H11422]|uniref:citryl-CoA lyase n=1 Tax=Pseudonocardia sp. H11422 TaxID=2835866 RepID=UPI001BDDAA4E|nr:citryl-CoA lyase [Pseudonocardia sp. H11422]
MSSSYRTGLGTSDLHHIRLMGQDLAGDMMGKVSFGELAFWMVAGRRPSDGESALFNAVLVALTDHGLTPMAIASRMTLTSAPESIQGAVASGLLGGGSRFLGVTEDVARFLAEGLAGAGNLRDESDYDARATQLLREYRERRPTIPGLGHPVHKEGDPRTPVIYEIATREGVLGPHLSLLAAVERVHPEVLGRTLPVNGAGVCGAALADLGFSPQLARGFALLARTAGLLAHVAEEMRDPIGLQLYRAVDERTEYVPAPPAG